MVKRIRPFHALFAWFSRGNRLTALVVITATVAVVALFYTYSNDRRATADRAAFYACVPRYISDLTSTTLPRTLASIAATDARFNWDRGFDEKHPGWSKAQLKAEYVRLYLAYQEVTASNPPIPAFSAQYCEIN